MKRKLIGTAATDRFRPTSGTGAPLAGVRNGAAILGDLLGAIEAPTVPDTEAPVRVCHR